MTKAQVARASRIAALVAALVGFADAALAQRPSEEQIAAIRQACRSDYIAHCAGIPPGGAQALACLREHLASVSPACQQAVNAVGAAASPTPAAQTPAPPPAAAAPESPSAAPPAVAGKAAAALDRMRPNTEQVGIILQACGADIDSHCAAAARGPGWELKCLRDNAASLSAGCEQVLLAIASTAPAEPAAPAAAAPAPAPAPAAAQRARPSREQIVMILRACRGDMREHCAGAEGGPGSRIKCLRDNAANLSPGCQQALAAGVSGAPAEPAAGASAAPPAGPPPAGGAPPRERPVSPRQVLFLIRTACDGDFRTYCRGVQFGGGRVIGCLRENAANLSPRCRQAFMSLIGGR
jgi:Cysteine rich repeat